VPVAVTRRRGKVWYAGGSVRVGRETRTVPEFSTGATSRTAAAEIAARADAEARRDLADGDAGRSRRVTIAEALILYVQRPGGIRSYDAARIAEINDLAGHRPLSDAPAAWSDWLATRGRSLQPPSVARMRATIQAALTHGAQALQLPEPRLPPVKGAQGPERAIYLPPDQRRRLLAAYNPHAGCPVLLLAYQGMRSQEALQLDWRHVDLTRRTAHVPADQSKTSKARTIPLHPRVDALLFGMWCAAGRPTTGPVFLSARGRPYADTRGRDGGRQGGNPLAQAHDTACRAAGVTGFRLHDWRHDWAARFIMAGGDLRTLMDLGGWSSLRMVQRYAWITPDHAAAAMARVA